MACSCVSSIVRLSVNRFIHKNPSPHRLLRKLHSSTFSNSPRGYVCVNGQKHLLLSDLPRFKVIVLGSAVRFNSSSAPATPNPSNNAVPESPYIPEPPDLPLVESIVGDAAECLGEPTLASLGLCGWTPVGLIEQCLEYLHIGLDMPWWLAIGLGTLVVKTVLLPLVVIAQRNAANMNNHLPQMQYLQMKLTEARRNGNSLDAAKYSLELVTFMKDKDLNPIKSLFVPLMQAPFFISFFFALRKMANLPIESMKDGGLFWFINLTVADPLYLLPIITSATLAITLELGIDGGVRAGNMQMMKYVLRALPLIMLPFTINFPSAVLCYWVASNVFSLAQVAVLRQPAVRRYFNIPQIVRHSRDATPLSNKGFAESFKETWTNSRIMHEVQDRYKVDEMRFRRAGQGPIQKTYPYNPATQKPPAEKTLPSIEAKPKT